MKDEDLSLYITSYELAKPEIESMNKYGVINSANIYEKSQELEIFPVLDKGATRKYKFKKENFEKHIDKKKMPIKTLLYSKNGAQKYYIYDNFSWMLYYADNIKWVYDFLDESERDYICTNATGNFEEFRKKLIEERNKRNRRQGKVIVQKKEPKNVDETKKPDIL